MRKKIIKNIPVILLALLFLPNLVLAGNDSTMIGKMKAAANIGGYQTEGDETKLGEVAGTIVGAFLALLGIIFIVLILLAGFHWMTAQGAEDKVRHAKDELRTAIIGLVLTLAAYGIYNFIWYYLMGNSAVG